MLARYEEYMLATRPRAKPAASVSSIASGVVTISRWNRPSWALRARCRPSPTRFTCASPEGSAKADHWPQAKRGRLQSAHE